MMSHEALIRSAVLLKVVKSVVSAPLSSRQCMCTIAAPALALAITCSATASGESGFPSPAPHAPTGATEIMTFFCIL